MVLSEHLCFCMITTHHPKHHKQQHYVRAIINGNEYCLGSPNRPFNELTVIDIIEEKQ